MRQLATVRQIESLKPIPNADKLELATMIDLGWECVVKKGEFKVGDLCIYIEIDSLLPQENPYWEFMSQRKHRVKTIKLRGQFSQGLIIPIDKQSDGYYLPECFGKKIKLELGQDVTELLKIVKYESETDKQSNQSEPFRKQSKIVKHMMRYKWFRKIYKPKKLGGFPVWIRKTDESRVQSEKWILTKHKDDEFYVSEKLDGTSTSYALKRKLFSNEFIICSRSMRKHIKDKSWWSECALQNEIKQKMSKYKNDVYIQGEIIGPKIQKNKYKRERFEFYLFNVYDLKLKRFLNLGEMKNYSTITGIPLVPIKDTHFKLPETVDELVKYSIGISDLYNTKREGFVIRTHDMTVSFKVINPEFLLSNDE